MDEPQRSAMSPGEGELPTWVLVAMIVGAAALMFMGMLGGLVPLSSAGAAIVIDGVMALLVLLAAGGYGWAVLRLVFPRDAAVGLRLATAAGLGLWLLSMAVLAVGSATTGGLTTHVWWPVIGAGLVLAVVGAHGPLAGAKLPIKLPGRSLVWVLVALAAGQWLAGAVLPAGWLGLFVDAGDAMERYLQLPREYYHAGQITTLNHNVYSHYPQSTEMLMLLGMCLRGGAYEGMALAKMIHGLFALVAVMAVFSGLRPGSDFRARAAAGLLATGPWVCYLFFPGLTQLAPVCFLAIALMWLRHWLAGGSWRSAGLIGAAVGAACSSGYAAIAAVAAPVLVVMLAAALRRGRRLGQVILAVALAAAVPAPWAVRNAAATGNPCFPLATGVFGAGHWSEASVHRWRSAFDPTYPVAGPAAAAEESPAPAPPHRLLRLLLGPYYDWPPMGAGVLLLLVGSLAAMLIRPRGAGAWDWALVAVVVAQVLAWMYLARGASARFVCSAVVPISLLCAGGLGRLAQVREVRWLRQKAGAGGYWGLAPATLLLTAVAVLNLHTSWSYLRTPGLLRICRPQMYPASTVLVGESRALWFASGVTYATAFDAQPLEGLIGPGTTGEQLADHLRGKGTTRVFASWIGIDDLADTFGWPENMSARRLEQLFAGWPVEEDYWRGSETRPASGPTSAPATAPATAPTRLHLFTVYAVPAAVSAATQPLDTPAGEK